jgi:cell division protease FtsH
MTAWESADGGGRFPNAAASEATEEAIDAAVSSICREAYERTKATLLQHRELLETVTARLVEKETVDGEELANLVGEATGRAPASR